jgi:prepilin-type N-terminal cleavage/methylation domain-containing protein
MTRSAKTISGFTLIELLIYMGILSILLVVLSQIFGSVLDAQLESESTSAVHRDGRFILSKLSYDIHKAQSIVTPAAIGNQSTSLQLTIEGINYTYTVSSGNLEITSGLETNNLNSGDTTVSNLTFTRIGNSVANAKNTVRITYTITSKIVRPKGMETKDFQTTIGIR